ncbi:phage major tail protein 2 [uncultured Mediterranean phage uvMED]|nr:phage major tail protein 2 [uncultured Mediterranean phage uvMED]BAQ93609.1 phage major tail protein 2 [uncultured Mediterranean phage uvMED]BAR25069.1 phage major tail protein 2 [uncultured Mediterranean phage uvMED]BAR25080.1 phage major tail protein 2 [uncultured Mediterranean phage uvMED]BAR25131.1 phage major tail protein 2 [uncultured Mediterranean phage uvMED]
MAILRGEQGSVEFETGGGTLGAVAGTRSWSLSIDKETLDVTAHGDTFRAFVGSLISGSGSVELIFNEGDATQKAFMDDVLKTADAVDATFELFREGTTNGADSFTFAGIITNAEISSTVGEIVTVSASFQTSGAIASNA